MSGHISSFGEDEDGWHVVKCSCGQTSPPLPDMETAADVWAEHYADALLGPYREFVRAYDAWDEPPDGQADARPMIAARAALGDSDGAP